MHRSASGKLMISGMALLALAAVMVSIPLPGAFALCLAVAAAGLGCFVAAWLRKREERYDLSRLWEAPPPDAEEPHRDHIPEDEESAPYCGWCDEAFPPGVRRCTRCGRDLG